jgi:hypothetical protein
MSVIDIGKQAPADGCVSVGPMDFCLVPDLYLKRRAQPPASTRGARPRGTGSYRMIQGDKDD